jgi:hypothetical protein
VLLGVCIVDVATLLPTIINEFEQVVGELLGSSAWRVVELASFPAIVTVVRTDGATTANQINICMLFVEERLKGCRIPSRAIAGKSLSQRRTSYGRGLHCF